MLGGVLHFSIFVALLVPYLRCVVNGDTAHEEELLRQSLGIDRMRPFMRTSPKCTLFRPIEMNMTMSLLQVLQVDEKNEILTTSVWLSQTWCDNRLVWDPSVNGGITQLEVDPELMWFPDVYLLNNADGSFDVDGAMSKIVVRFDGSVIWVNPAIFKSSCQLDVTYFPLDDQMCRLEFGSMTYDINHFHIRTSSNSIDIGRYQDNGEWVLLETSAENDVRAISGQQVARVSYDLKIRRRILYYVMNFIMPCVLIAVLTLLVFLLPPESGERVSYGITVILSFTFLIVMLYQKMPVTSAAVPLIGVYYACITFEVSTALALCCGSLRFYHHDPPTDEVPRWIKNVVLNWCARLVRLKSSVERVRQERILHTWQEAAYAKPGITVSALDVIMADMYEKEDEKVKCEEWRICAAIVNRLFLWLFVLTSFVTFFAVFLTAPRVRSFSL